MMTSCFCMAASIPPSVPRHDITVAFSLNPPSRISSHPIIFLPRFSSIFSKTVASGASDADIIEKIDIGGISLIRAGAKNFKDVVIVPSKAEYSVLLDILKKKGAETDIEDRKMFAERAFGVSSHYDTAIHAWFAK